MAMTLSPALEKRIQRMVDGGYQDAEQVVESALDLLEETNGITSLREMRDRIDEGWQAAERGDTISSEEFALQMDAWRAKVNATP